jgi:hypothetical protein
MRGSNVTNKKTILAINAQGINILSLILLYINS